MCLDKLTDFPVKLNDKGEGEGYKAFCKYQGEWLSGIYFRRGNRCSYNKWLDEKDYREDKRRKYIQSSAIKYPCGWHIFKRKKDADAFQKLIFSKSFPVKKVRFKGIVTRGKQYIFLHGSCPVIVAKYIYIPKGVNK